MNYKIVEHVFFFGLLLGAAIIVWKLIAPFAGALALAAIITTICFPLHERILRSIPGGNRSLAAFLSVVLVLLCVVIPLGILGSFILREALSLYALSNESATTNIAAALAWIENLIRNFMPDFSINLTQILEQAAGFIATHLVSIFAGTASTFFNLFMVLIASFYFFRDGKDFTAYLIQMSPLSDSQDNVIIFRLANAVRSVALGTVFIALIQGSLTGIGLAIFGFDRAVLWGTIAAFGALIPGVGTTIVFVPAIIYLVVTGSYMTAAGVALWAVLAVGVIDNILGPYLMSRGNKLHPFLILISVLGGIALMGPIGFILGPVVLSFFIVMLELNAQHHARAS